MIAFDSSKISIEIVELKSVTTALGGSINIVDTTNSKGYARIEVPMAASRAFIKKHKVTKYLIPVLTAIVRYDNRIISMERHPLGSLGVREQEGLDGTMQVWKSDSERNLDGTLVPTTNRGEWFFDGRYVYRFKDQIDNCIRTATALTEDKLFRSVIVDSIDLQDMSSREKLQPTERCCMAFVTQTGMYSISPPIWKNLDGVGSSHLPDIVSDEVDIMGMKKPQKISYSFDQIDQHLSVNLNFALKAGKEISKLFGFESIEPLHLAELMVELHTVNLPNIPKQVKSTYDVHIKFTHALSWLLGLSRKANTLETYIVMRSLMKYLTQKGIFKNDTFKASHIFIDGKSAKDIETINCSTVLNDLEEVA